MLVDDGSEVEHIRPALAAAAQGDAQVRRICRERNGGIASSMQAGLAAAKGELSVLLDGDDELRSDALAEMVLRQRESNADWRYSDFVLKRPDGKLGRPFFKTDPSPERLMSQMYLNHLEVMRTELVWHIGGFRPGFDGGQDYELALRLMEATGKIIAHVPKALSHRRVDRGSTIERYDEKMHAGEAAKRALRTALVRRGLGIATDHHDGRDGCDVDVEDGLAPGTFAVVAYKLGRGTTLGPAPKVSILIPFRDGWAVTQRCFDSIFGKSSYLNCEIILIDKGFKEEVTRQGIESFTSRHREAICLRDDSPFNHLALNNLGRGMRAATLSFCSTTTWRLSARTGSNRC